MTPLAGLDLATLDDSVAENMNTMREAAESAETDDFNPAIDAASGSAATALQNGKIKNKVLKLTGEVQVLQIKLAKAQAAGSDTSSIESDIATEQCVFFCLVYACARRLTARAGRSSLRTSPRTRRTPARPPRVSPKLRRTHPETSVPQRSRARYPPSSALKLSAVFYPPTHTSDLLHRTLCTLVSSFLFTPI